jgi:hypothetical protein
VFDDALARDPNAEDTVRASLRFLVCRRVDVELRVQEHEVSSFAGFDPTAVGETEQIGGARRQPCDAFIHGQQPLPKDEAAEEAGSRAVEARMGLRSEDAVRAD